MNKKILSIKGMNDILPAESATWEWLEQKVRILMAAYSYENIRTPIVESTELFLRGLGEVTDIVEKEMYSFEDRLNGDHLTLRPENTAAVIRAASEHSLLYSGGKRLYYMGPMFRHERPQRGRYRQFHQIGAEALGYSGPEVDVELILLARQIFDQLGLTNIDLEINSLGDAEERSLHRKELISFFEKNINELDEDAKRRMYLNPLRVLDSKNPNMQKLLSTAPNLLDFLGDKSLKHMNALTSMLDATNIRYKINHRLVRGLDYYNLTVFEFITTSLGSQGTICAGGRYDYLMSQITNDTTPAVGWALGVERIIELLKEQNKVPKIKCPQIYAIITNEKFYPYALQNIKKLRDIGFNVKMDASNIEGVSSMRSQFKRANNSGANFALIFGEQEFHDASISVKNLRNSAIEQITINSDEVEQWFINFGEVCNG